MRKFVYRKLVRDKILDSMEAAGSNVTYHVLSDNDYLKALKSKLLEEAHEMESANEGSLVEEIADLQEVVDSIVVALGKTKQDITAHQNKKNKKVGSFSKRIYVESVELLDTDPWVTYLQENPERYPEVS